MKSLSAFRPGKSADVPIMGTAPMSSFPISAGTTHVRLLATANCYVSIGGTATAGSSMRLFTGFPEVFIISPGQTVSVKGDSTGGQCNVTELTR